MFSNIKPAMGSYTQERQSTQGSEEIRCYLIKSEKRSKSDAQKQFKNIKLLLYDIKPTVVNFLKQSTKSIC